MYKHIFIPIDETSLSMLVIERGLALARSLGARASFLYLTPDASDLIEGDAGLLHAMAPTLFARKYLWADGYAEAKARAWARMYGVEAAFIGGSSKGKVYEEIIAAAQDRGAELIVVGSHGRSTVLQRLFDSVTVKLILHSPLPVFVVETGVAPESVKSRVIAGFREEHAAWLALADRLVDALREPQACDPAVIDDALALLGRVAGEIHGPREARLLEALNASDQGAAAALTRIRTQHEDEPGLFAALRTAWERRATGGHAAARTAAAAWRDFVVAHVRDENNMLLLRADDSLSEADWHKVATEVLAADWQAARAQRKNDYHRLLARFDGEDS